MSKSGKEKREEKGVKKNRQERNSFRATTVALWTFILTIFGFILIIIALCIDPKISQWSSTIATLGAGVLVGCIFSVILQRRELKDYVGEEVSEVIQGESYLQKLSSDQLKELRVKIDKQRIGAPHLEHSESLYSFISENLQDPFVNEPHRVGVVKNILVEEKLDDAENFKVTEFTSYRIRHIAFPRTGQPVDYTLKVHSEIRAKYIDKDKTDYRLLIKVDDVEMMKEIELEEKGYQELIDEMQKIEGYYVAKVDDNYTLFFFQKTISLEKEFTQISIREDSLMEKHDRLYTYNSAYPTYHVSINLILPKDYIIHEPTIGNRFYLKKEKPSQVNTIEGVGSNNISVTLNSWILPGIIVAIYWDYPAQRNSKNI